MTTREDIIAAGPKEVRTPNMTVVAHDPVQVTRMRERNALTRLPTLCSIGGCTSAPKPDKYEMFTDRYDCRRAD